MISLSSCFALSYFDISLAIKSNLVLSFLDSFACAVKKSKISPNPYCLVANILIRRNSSSRLDVVQDSYSCKHCLIASKKSVKYQKWNFLECFDALPINISLVRVKTILSTSASNNFPLIASYDYESLIKVLVLGIISTANRIDDAKSNGFA